MTLLLIISLIALFYVLSKAADLVVINIKKIAEELGVRVFLFGLILGFLTSLPELAIGINTTLRGAPDIALGNLLGGILVLFGLILGGNLIMNHRIATHNHAFTILPVVLYLLLPFIVGFSRTISRVGGIFFVALYFFLLPYLARHHYERHTPREERHKRKFTKKIFLILCGLIAVVGSAQLITHITLTLLAEFQIPAFFVGLVTFSLGTNLPELIVTIRSWRRHLKDLSLANLIGSAIANIFIIGILALITPLSLPRTPHTYVLFGFFCLLSLALFIFYKRARVLTRREGIVLVGIYVAFLGSQYLLL